jgi:hypothetical protein
MTDLETMEEMLNRNRVTFKKGREYVKERVYVKWTDPVTGESSMIPEDRNRDIEVTILTVEAGYTGFFSELTFDDVDGRLLHIKAWE